MKEEENDDVKEGEMLREEMRVVVSERVSLMEERASEMIGRMEGGLMGRDERLEEIKEGMEERFNQHTTAMNEMKKNLEEKVDRMEENQQRIEENQKEMIEKVDRMDEKMNDMMDVLHQLLINQQSQP